MIAADVAASWRQRRKESLDSFRHDCTQFSAPFFPPVFPPSKPAYSSWIMYEITFHSDETPVGCTAPTATPTCLRDPAVARATCRQTLPRETITGGKEHTIRPTKRSGAGEQICLDNGRSEGVRLSQCVIPSADDLPPHFLLLRSPFLSSSNFPRKNKHWDYCLGSHLSARRTLGAFIAMQILRARTYKWISISLPHSLVFSPRRFCKQSGRLCRVELGDSSPSVLAIGRQQSVF